MPGLQLQPFADEHVDAAAALLAERHRRHRAAEPLLPDGLDFDAEVAVLAKDGASGMVALRDGRVAGYLLGAPGDDSIWGANEWVELAGHAVEDAEVVRDLYGAVAQHWLDEGRNRHYVVVPATDAELVDAWFRLGFGQQQAFGIREVPPEPWPEEVREAEPRDVGALLELAPLLNRHQGASPVFGGRPLDPVDELRAELEQDIAADGFGNLVAEVDGRVVGVFQVVPVELSSMHVGLARPAGSSFLSFAVTAPEVRGSGVGVALARASLAWAHARGHEVMVTDWRVTNLLSSRFWPRRGFRTTFLRLYRSIP